jgi:hypothetical protein
VNKVAVVSFGRLNPITVGHYKMCRAIKDAAIEHKGTPLLYLSHSYDGKDSSKPKQPSKNPLSYEDKLKFVRDAVGDIVTVVESDALSPWEMLGELYREGMEIVYMFGGSDRVEEYQRVINYNNEGDPSDKKFFAFERIEILNAGERDDNSDDPESKASGSLLRKLVIEQDYDEFEKFAGTKTLTEEMFDTLTYELGIE